MTEEQMPAEPGEELDHSGNIYPQGDDVPPDGDPDTPGETDDETEA